MASNSCSSTPRFAHSGLSGSAISTRTSIPSSALRRMMSIDSGLSSATNKLALAYSQTRAPAAVTRSSHRWRGTSERCGYRVTISACEADSRSVGPDPRRRHPEKLRRAVRGDAPWRDAAGDPPLHALGVKPELIGKGPLVVLAVGQRRPEPLVRHAAPFPRRGGTLRDVRLFMLRPDMHRLRGIERPGSSGSLDSWKQ